MLYVHVESSRPIEAHHQQPDYFLAQGPFAGDQILSMGARWNQSSTLNDLCTDKHHSKPSDYVHKINLLRLSSGCMGRVNFDRQAHVRQENHSVAKKICPVQASC